MPLTKAEKTILDTLYEIKTSVALIQQQNKAMFDTHERMKVDVKQLKKTVYENGLNSKVDELHEWMTEQKIAAQQVKEEQKEIKLLGMKLSGDTRLAIIQGTISLGGIVIAYFLGGK